MSKRETTIEKLLRLLVEMYARTQTPILIKNALESHEGKKSIFSDFNLGNSYKTEVFIELGILKVLETYSVRKLKVVWDTRYPDRSLATDLYNRRTIPDYKRYRAEKAKKQMVQKDVVTQKEEKPEINIIERNSGIDFLDDFTEAHSTEFATYTPQGKTIPKLSKAIAALRKNTKDGFCHRDKMYLVENLDDDGNFKTLDCSLDNNYNPTRLVSWGVLEVNPDNRKEFRLVVEPKNFNFFVRQLAFYVHNYRNGTFRKKEETTATEEILHLDVPETQTDQTTEDAKVLYEKMLVVQQEILTAQKDSAKSIEESTEKFRQNVLRFIEAVDKLNATISAKNNLEE